MTFLDSANQSLKLFAYVVGYALTSTWATVLLFSSSFSSASTPNIVTTSMLSGVFACVGVLLLRKVVPTFNGRTPAASVYATGMAIGTLLCTHPALSANPGVHNAGLVVSGFFAILLILTWFEAYAQLNSRTIVALAGAALLVAAAGCFVVLALPIEASSLVMAALPLVSFSCLPKPRTIERPADTQHALIQMAREAVSWKTLLGVVISFFVIGAIGILAPRFGLTAQLSPLYLAIPAAIAAIFVATAFVAPKRIDASILFKLLLVGVAALAFVLGYYGDANLALVFFVYITADVLLWTVLELAAKKTPVQAYAVFAIGWLAECLGNVLGHNVAAATGDTPLLFALVMLAILVGVGFAFGDGLFVLDLEDEHTGEGGGDGDVAHAALDPSGTPAPQSRRLADASLSDGGPSSWQESALGTPNADTHGENIEEASASMQHERQAPTQEQAIADFVERHGISAREADVFALWVTGHGQKHIQNTLFISESTVKTHLRSIYRKCDTHSRAEIIALFEQELEES